MTEPERPPEQEIRNALTLLSALVFRAGLEIAMVQDLYQTIERLGDGHPTSKAAEIVLQHLRLVRDNCAYWIKCRFGKRTDD
jgi:hypothetical protein